MEMFHCSDAPLESRYAFKVWVYDTRDLIFYEECTCDDIIS